MDREDSACRDYSTGASARQNGVAGRRQGNRVGEQAEMPIRSKAAIHHEAHQGHEGFCRFVVDFLVRRRRRGMHAPLCVLRGLGGKITFTRLS
jgi:hypothetical protein